MSKTIVIAGAGDVAKYLIEELLLVQKKYNYKIILLSRARRDWFTEKKNIEIRITDYTLESLEPLLKDVDVLITLLHDNSQFYVDAHVALIEACKRSPRCKRMIPSECGGDIEQFPNHPLFYVPTHVVVREILAQQTELEYTLFNLGWFMDYFIPENKSYMKRLPGVWPLDENSIRILGTGDEPVTFTSARNVAQAMVTLVQVDKWEVYTYVEGETTTWNRVKEYLEKKTGKMLTVIHRPLADIQSALTRYANDSDKKELWLACMDLWNALGAAAVPQEKTRRQRQQYFADIDFYTIERLIDAAEKIDGVV
jgi:nucleoside-diphosphate-sugar epimerase